MAAPQPQHPLPEDGGGVQEKAHEAVSQAQEKAEQLKEQGNTRLHSEVETRSTEIGEQATSLAEALRRSANDLDGKPAAIVTGAAERIESLGHYLRDGDADKLLGDVEGMARRQPWLAGGLGAAAGFVAARFLKASSDRRYVTSRQARDDADAPISREHLELGDSGATFVNEPRRGL
jgi:hypothetical protein